MEGTPHTQKGDFILFNHIFDNIENLEGNCFDDLHYHLFNEDYFIIGYHKAEQFIKENDLNIFDLIQYCQQREKEEFGEIETTFNNAETLVNQYAYWRGQELLYTIKTLEKFDYEREDDNITDKLIKDVQNELNLSQKLNEILK
tara:strand:+ start:258 stop:689 length:432 start_codon:yes stop_codon:yes gene_type:complete